MGHRMALGPGKRGRRRAKLDTSHQPPVECTWTEAQTVANSCSKEPLEEISRGRRSIPAGKPDPEKRHRLRIPGKFERSAGDRTFGQGPQWRYAVENRQLSFPRA